MPPHEGHDHEPAPDTQPLPVPVPGPTPTPTPMTAEMQAADDLVVVSSGIPWITAWNSGCWCEPAVWANNQLPTEDMTIVVREGVTLTLMSDDNNRACKAIRVEGTLRLEPGAGLTCETLLITQTGSLEIGTPDAPIQRDNPVRVTIADAGPIDRTADPQQLGRGVVSLGRIAIYGEEVTPFVQLQDAVRKGAKTLILSTEPTNWRTGDRIVISSIAPGQHEWRTIASITGRTLGLSLPLDRDRLPPPTINPEVAARMRCHVANVERSIEFVGSTKSVDRHGHLMSMCSADLVISGASFFAFGRTDKRRPIAGDNPRGRYALHIHRAGHDQTAKISRCVVASSPGWGIVNHSSRADVEDNVVVDAYGASFVTEQGDETGSFRRNLAIGSTGSGKPRTSREDVQDFGHGGHGFWFQGPYVAVNDNIATGHPDSGIVYWCKGLIFGGIETTFPASALDFADRPGAGEATALKISSLPVSMDRNAVYGCLPLALEIFNCGMSKAPNAEWNAYVNELFAWGVQGGIYVAYGSGIGLSLPTIIGSSGTGLGLDSGPQWVCISGGYFDRLATGVMMPYQGAGFVYGGTYNSTVGVRVVPYISDSEFGRTITIRNVKAGSGCKLKVQMDWRLAQSVPKTQMLSLFGEDLVVVDGRRVRASEQAGHAIFAAPWWPPEWLGLTNQQILQLYGVALGGSLADFWATRDPVGTLIDGFVDPPPARQPQPPIKASAIAVKSAANSYQLRIEGVVDKLPTTLTPGRLHAIKRTVNGQERTVLAYAQ